jgi:hypothetical protein
MLTKIMKWVSMAALLLAAMFWGSAANYRFLLASVVCLGASIVVVQAIRAKEYAWAVGFVAMALLFNPIVPVFRLSGQLNLLLVLACIAPFAVSLVALKTQPLLSIPSITDRNPGSESL